MRQDSESDVSNSNRSESGGESYDSASEVDPVLEDLRDGILPVSSSVYPSVLLNNRVNQQATPAFWTPSQLAGHLRSRDHSSLADLVMDNQITGSAFIELSYPITDAHALCPNMSDEKIDKLLEESRRLRQRILSRRDTRVRKAVSFYSEESGADDADTPKSISRQRVKHMVAAIESELK